MDQPTAFATVAAARALASAGNVDGAIAKLEAVLGERPDDAPTLALLAAFELRRSRLDQAEEAAGAAVKADPELPLAHRVLGLVH
jgi:Flp pilus assembly protein TadD